MGRVKLGYEKRRHALTITLPGHIIQRIDAIPTTCNRSELFEALIKKGLYYYDKERFDEENT
jgi:hypothetical protein